MRFYIERLGCPKNDTDAEGMSQLLVEAGYVPCAGPDEADIVVVNTCGFVDSAKDESLGYLQQYAKTKRRRDGGPRTSTSGAVAGARSKFAAPGSVPGSARQKILIAAGCFSERFGAELARSVPEIDGIIGTQRWTEIPALLDDILHTRRALRVGKGNVIASVPRVSHTPSAYVKIADGCSVGCAFCAIPKMKGPHRSKAAEEVVSEVRQLADAGVREVILIAQNTAAYGHDWGQREALADLLDQIVQTSPHLPWIRLMYAYPEHITDRLIETMARHEQVVKYLDMPLQHAHPEVLRRMKRPVVDARPLLSRLRECMLGVALRSAFIVGYPQETEAEFQTLLSFLDEVKLDRVGIFQYSPEEGTLAASLSGQVSPRIKAQRQRRAMRLLREISACSSQALVGAVMDVLVVGAADADQIADLSHDPGDSERKTQKSASGRAAPSGAMTFLSVGRCYRDAPEVDGLVFLDQRVPVGSFVRAKIIGASEYDLFAALD